ncbi:hypothetical protein [Deinococcus hohokamensis]|uniref:Uncharacterized protein n=1 Tax=Deinococcus hohokamensis TaxID=309883 RepID=A0ABV9IEV4_9DEIO
MATAQDEHPSPSSRWRVWRGLKRRTKQVGRAAADTIDFLGTVLDILLIVPRLIWAVLRALGDLFNV